MLCLRSGQMKNLNWSKISPSTSQKVKINFFVSYENQTNWLPALVHSTNASVYVHVFVFIVVGRRCWLYISFINFAVEHKRSKIKNMKKKEIRKINRQTSREKQNTKHVNTPSQTKAAMNGVCNVFAPTPTTTTTMPTTTTTNFSS